MKPWQEVGGLFTLKLSFNLSASYPGVGETVILPPLESFFAVICEDEWSDGCILKAKPCLSGLIMLKVVGVACSLSFKEHILRSRYFMFAQSIQTLKNLMHWKKPL